MARHISPNDHERTATAPYNFVPLPNKIFSVEEGFEINGEKVDLWETHDQFVPGTRSGWIDLEIKTLTPLFIRGPVTQSSGEWDKRDSRFRPHPFVNKDGVPVIPGSSLRGMIRCLVEVLSFSKISPVTAEKPFFRTVAPDRIGKAYRNRMIHGRSKPSGGYINKVANSWSITPAVEVLRVHHEQLSCCGITNHEQVDSNYHPSWFCQQKPCWFQRSGLDSEKVGRISLTEKVAWEKGILVLTGFVENKKYEFVFVGEDASKRIEIPERIWQRFHEKVQLTQWQENAFPKDQPSSACRKANGYLRDGEPVFFIADNSAKSEENPDGLLFFGRAQMFRFPYDFGPCDLISEDLKNTGLDMAEALFGQVPHEGIKNGEAIKGRVFFGDAEASGNRTDWFEDTMVPQILFSPKVTCFQHYLTQDGTTGKEALTTYLNGDHTTIRGAKMYWHRWDDGQRLDAVKEAEKHGDLLKDLQKKEIKTIKDIQHTIIRPVKDNVVFRGRVRFNNLTDIELGALLAALSLPEGCAHKLGMGKPLGLGSIQIEPQLYLVDRSDRYTCWENAGVQGCDGDDFLNTFETEILAHARGSEETIDESKFGLFSIGRLQVLYHLLMWQTRPQLSDTAYLPLGRFRDRPVLPTPHKVIGQQEPHWLLDPPRIGVQKAVAPKTKSLESPSTDTSVTKPTVTPKDILKGQQRRGTLMHRGEIWIAMFDGDHREAVIVNADKIQKNATEGVMAEFYIMEQNKKKGIRVRFEKLVTKK